MSTILISRKVKYSERNYSSKHEQAYRLMQIMLWCAKAIKKYFKIFALFIDLSESYMLQIYFAKTARTTLRIPDFNFSFEFVQKFDLFYLNQQNFSNFWTQVTLAL